MKTRFITSLLLVGIAFQVLAQHVENDDMYFRKKDREKLKNQEEEFFNGAFYAQLKKNKTKDAESVEVVNPTDSYSAENINPEYISRVNSKKAMEEESYFDENYSYNSSKYSGYNFKYTNPWNSSIGFNNAWLSSPYVWNDPYFYSPYGYNPWMSNPYTGGFGYSSGWSLSMSYYWGNSWGSGCNYGLTYGWGNPQFTNYYSRFYSPYFYNSWGNPYYGGGYYYEKSTNYGKRPSRNSALVTPTKRITSTLDNGGRMRKSRDNEYYIKPSRRTGIINSNEFTHDYSSSRVRNVNQNNNSTPTFSRPTRNINSVNRTFSRPTGFNNSGASPSRSIATPSQSSGRSRGN